MNQDNILRLVTLSIDLRELQEIDERGDEIELFFGENYTPSRIILKGADAEAMEAWLDKDWEEYREHLIAQGRTNVPSLRTRFGSNPDEIDDDTPPPF